MGLGEIIKECASLEAILPIIQEQAVPSCPKPRMWSILEEIIEDSLNCRHHDKIPNRTHPGKASNGQDGCPHHNNLSNACPGKASDGIGTSDHHVGRHHDNPPNASPGKASTSKGITDHRNATPPRRSPKRLRVSTLPLEPTLPRRKFQSVVVVINTSLRIWPKNMMEIIKYILKSTSGCPELLLFKFKMNREAAESNFHVLWRFNFDLGRALEAQVKFPMGYGSEFRKREVLLPLLQHHLLLNRMMNMLAHGLQWPTKPITKEDRATDLIKVLNFGSHKGATSQPELLLKLVSGNVKYGYTLPLPLGKIRRIHGICMAPLNVQMQWTINERGEIIEKDRLTHNQSFEWEKSGSRGETHEQTPPSSNNANSENAY
jgi:hypothetical protein